jgi:hypothetical protein
MQGDLLSRPGGTDHKRVVDSCSRGEASCGSSVDVAAVLRRVIEFIETR